MTPARPPLLLASTSPRRRQLLEQLGAAPDATFAPDIDESPRPGELPRVYAVRLAEEKARAAVAHRDTVLPGAVIIAGDTTVALGRRILPPAETPQDVARLVGLLSGRRHSVLSAVSVISPGGTARTRLARATVQFKRLSADELAAYAACGEGVGKAGGYAIQGRAAGLVQQISGSYTAIVGLPLFETRQLLCAAGFADL